MFVSPMIPFSMSGFVVLPAPHTMGMSVKTMALCLPHV